MIVRGALPHEWDTAKHYLRKLAEHGAEWWTYDQLKDDVRTRRRQLWFMVSGDAPIAAGLTSLIAGGRIAYIDGVVGRSREAWAGPFHHAVRAWAKAHGATEIRVRARRGWAAEAAELGYRETHREYRARV